MMQLALSHLGYRPDSPKTVTLCPDAGHSTAEFTLPERLDEIAEFLARNLRQADGSDFKKSHP
jgi:hypothetical protein